MSVDVSGWSARKKLKHRLLQRAIRQERGAEVILLMQWRTAQERHKNKAGVKLAKVFEQENAGQPRAIRALNLQAALQGVATRYKDNAAGLQDAFSKKSLAEMLNDPGRERIIVPSRQFREFADTMPFFSDMRPMEASSGEDIADDETALDSEEYIACTVDSFSVTWERAVRERHDMPASLTVRETDYVFADLLPAPADPVIPDDLERLAMRHAGPALN